VDIARLEEASTVQDLILEVKIAYFNILQGRQDLTVARPVRRKAEAHRDAAQDFYDVGLIPRNDLLPRRLNWPMAGSFLLRAENDVELARSRFNTVFAA